MQKKQRRRKRDVSKLYEINQCALYKVRSIEKLSQVLNIGREHLESVLDNPLSYREFLNKETYDPFSKKTTKARYVQEPVGVLRRIQERILYLLQPVILPAYAHAAVKGRSYRSNADAHVKSVSLATFDLKNFYGSTKSHLVYYFFLDNLQCTPDVAGVLKKLTTFRGGMPTGSPLSPLLSLHAARPMLDKIAGLANEHNLIFTCYIDDLTLSGKRIPRSLERNITKIVDQHGYRLSNHKTRFFGKNDPKHVTGVVIHNGKLEVPYSRFLTARNLEAAIDGHGSMHGLTRLKLHEKRAGLLGEAAYIDPSFRHWAINAQVDLKMAKLEEDIK